MDSREASVYRFGAEEIEQARLGADNPYLKVGHKAGVMGAGRPAADLDFLDRIIDSLRGIDIWCLVGPDGAKNDLIDYLDKYKNRDGHIAELRLQLYSVTSMDRPTDNGLLDMARQTANASPMA
jgi:hypothetical protein